VNALRDELIAAISEWDQRTPEGVRADTPLITSARLDSLNLLRLLLWIEQKVERKVDATAIDLAAEWDTVDAIVAFVEHVRSRR
jgi:acyl carrier protein